MKAYIKLYSELEEIVIDGNKIYRDDNNDLLNVYQDNLLIGIFSLPDIKGAYIGEDRSKL